MGSLLLKFVSSKVGISSIAFGLVLLVGGIQQLRINAYQSEVKTLKLTVELKESEAIDLQTAINNQNTQIQQLKTTALANEAARKSQVLALKFKHMQDYKKLNQGKGPEDLNLWFKKTLR